MLFQWAAVTFSIHTPFKVLFFVKNIGQWNAKSGPKAAYGNFAMRKKKSGSLKKKWKRKGRNGSHFAHTHTHSAKLVVRMGDSIIQSFYLLRLRSACFSWIIGLREVSISYGHWRSGELHLFEDALPYLPSFFCRLLAISTLLYVRVFLSAVWERGQPFPFSLL